jgi:hypothetical protein
MVEGPGNRNRSENVGKVVAVLEEKERRCEVPTFFRSYPIWAAWGVVRDKLKTQHMVSWRRMSL